MSRELIRLAQSQSESLKTLSSKICCLTSGGNSSNCGCDCSALMVDVDFTEVLTALESICDKIEEQTLENENNLKCSKAVFCAPDCQSVICHTCYDVEGAIASTNHTLPSGTPYDGDLDALDPTCSKCSDPTPTFEILNIPVCYESCVTGYTLIKVNTADDSVTPLGTFYSDGTPSTEDIVPCPEYRVLESEACGA